MYSHFRFSVMHSFVVLLHAVKNGSRRIKVKQRYKNDFEDSLRDIIFSGLTGSDIINFITE